MSNRLSTKNYTRHKCPDLTWHGARVLSGGSDLGEDYGGDGRSCLVGVHGARETRAGLACNGREKTYCMDNSSIGCS